MSTVSQDLVRAYCDVRNVQKALGELTGFQNVLLADALRDTLADATREGFWRHHTDNRWCFAFGTNEPTCVDPRHDWKWPDWQAEADRQLRGES